jgi:WD40 repeat protein
MVGKLAGLAACLWVLLLAASAGASARNLSSMSGEEVKLLQQRLADAGCYQGAVDGAASPMLDAASKSCPNQDPVLRIETGMHVAPIRSIGVDVACRLAATGSDDKTVRLWSLPDGHLIRTQRLPIGDADEGQVHAVAISPDGSLVAAAGVDAAGNESMTSGVYLFDAATGVSVRRLGPFKGSIYRLAMSPDGKRLAVALEADGVRVLDIASGQQIMADREFAASSYEVEFGPDGSLYASGWDGILRRYEPAQYRRVARVKAKSTQLMGLAIDPAGERVAISYRDSTRIDLFDARTLKTLGSADTGDIGEGNGSLQFLAWLQNGSLLGAGSTRQISGDYPIVARLFDAHGRRLAEDRPIAADSIFDMTRCGAGAAFASAQPSFGLIGADGPPQTLGLGRMVDMRGKLAAAFQVSNNGGRVYFGLGVGGTRPALFDLANGSLSEAASAPDGLLQPDVTGLPVSDWRDSLAMRLGDKLLSLPAKEAIYALAVRPDKTGFIVGASHSIVGITASGAMLWFESSPATTWGVDLARDGDIIVAAYGDGTIRWRRWSDRKELLALFVDAPTKRWVAWTPAGYYMASSGGEDLIGWQVNRGWQQPADFFPASRFRDRFNRPDIVKLVLEELDEDAAAKKANAAARRREDAKPLVAQLPPVVRIADPAGGAQFSTGDVTLSYSWRSPSGQPVERIEVLIDGRPVKEVGLALNAKTGDAEHPGSLSVSVPPRDAEIGLIAWSGDLSSEVARIKLVWGGAPAAGGRNRRLFGLAVGVSDYVAPDMALAYAAKDARDFATALEGQKGGYYSDVAIHVIADREVTRASIIAGLEWLEKQATGPDDVGVLFLAGHGLTDEKQSYWFLPSDATADDAHVKGVSQDEVRRSLQSLSGKVLWFLDTCHAGGAARRPPPDVNLLVNNVTAAENGGIVAFASSTGLEVSVESSEWGNGAFTKAIVEGIERGKADLFGEGTITTSELDAFLEKRVQQLTDGKQHPVMGRPPEEPDFTIAQARKQ